MPPSGHGHESLSQGAVTAYALTVAALVLGAGLMSGLTLGLLSLDILDLRVVEASGTARQAAAARKLLPLVQRPHWLLCTLLLANAACMEALPLFLDRLLDPVAALLLSVTAILLFGEVLPQAICSRFGVKIGAAFAPLVRVLMWLTSPVTWPLGKLLDAVLGHKEVAMQRQELKALVELHGERAGEAGRAGARQGGSEEGLKRAWGGAPVGADRCGRSARQGGGSGPVAAACGLQSTAQHVLINPLRCAPLPPRPGRQADLPGGQSAERRDRLALQDRPQRDDAP
jgi:hypothetical protein